MFSSRKKSRGKRLLSILSNIKFHVFYVLRSFTPSHRRHWRWLIKHWRNCNASIGDNFKRYYHYWNKIIDYKINWERDKISSSIKIHANWISSFLHYTYCIELKIKINLKIDISKMEKHLLFFSKIDYYVIYYFLYMCQICVDIRLFHNTIPISID